MLKDTEGCLAVAEAVALCRPAMICAYPNAAQARIVECLAELARSGELRNCEFLNVDSDFAAMSIAAGASAAGARTYTVAASQGLLLMADAVHSAAGLGLPVVMTVSNCAVGVPIHVWNDHTDGMSMRDSGWIQLYADTRQEALDLHIQGFRLAEALSCPVMVCVDGLMLAHAYARVDVPSQMQVDDYLPPLKSRRIADPANPVSVGSALPSDAFMEMRYLLHHKQLRALKLIPQLASEFMAHFDRPAGGLLHTHLTDDAETIVVALGSVNGAIREVVDLLREDGVPIGSVSIRSFRPFPLLALRDVLQNAKRVLVMERALAVGLGGILSDGVRESAAGLTLNTYTVIAGLGGRDVTPTSLKQLFEDATLDELEQVTFLDLNADLVARELEREAPVGQPIPRSRWD